MSQSPGPAHKVPQGPKTGNILAGLILGAVAGVVANLAWGETSALASIIHYGTEPAGQMWLRALIMVVIPLVFARLSLGVAGLGDLHKLGRVGLKTLLFFLVVTSLAAVLGLSLVNLVRPGVGLSPEARERLLETYHQDASQSKVAVQRGQFGIQTLVNVVPRNPLAAAAQGDMLGVIFFSLAFGVALALLPPDRTKVLEEALRGLGDVMMVIIDLVMKLAPYGVFALLFTVTARFGLDLLARLGWYILTVIAGLAIFEFGVYSVLIRIFTGWSPWNFFHRAWTAILTAFSTSSSNATLPTTLEVCEDSLGLPREVCGFVVPMGATMCMNGTALFEGVTVLFIAQVFGIHLRLSSQ
ncbi:MAG TPA: dicarboxylate/amino acid:cation symporter, partial [Terriglobia bacterium]|nr:dicarboxylate/amino acid:cation symporter [Terriglobia bacterium]